MEGLNTHVRTSCNATCMFFHPGGGVWRKCKGTTPHTHLRQDEILKLGVFPRCCILPTKNVKRVTDEQLEDIKLMGEYQWARYHNGYISREEAIENNR